MNGINGAHNEFNGINSLESTDGLGGAEGVNGNGYHRLNTRLNQNDYHGEGLGNRSIIANDSPSPEVIKLDDWNESNIIANRDRYLLTFAAHHEKTLKANVAAYQRSCHKWSLPDLTYTLSLRRSSLPYRCSTIATEGKIHEALDLASLVAQQKIKVEPTKLGFVFTGVFACYMVG